VDGQEMFGFAAVVAEFFPQLHDHLVERACRAYSCSPRLRSAVCRATTPRRMRVKDLQQFQLLGCKFIHRFAAFDLESFWVNRG